MTTNDVLAGKSVLITGANRGLGKALVDEVLTRGVHRVYAASRRPGGHPDPRVTALRLDITDPEQVRAVSEQVGSLDVLVNNAAIFVMDDLSDQVAIQDHLAVNLFGTYDITMALLPQLTASRGAIVNVLSLAALATVPITPAYSISKAASLSMTQSFRFLLAERGVRVHAALPGPIDTDMIRGWEVPKTSPQDVARGILDGFEIGREEIFPDPMSSVLEPSWESGVVKMLERGNAAALQTPMASR